MFIKSVCIIILFLLRFCESIDFDITSFGADATNIVFSGDAKVVPSSGVIELNNVRYLVRVGHAKYADPIQIWDRKSGKLSDFTTHFTFIVDTQARAAYGDAFSFFLAPVGFDIPPNSGGEFIGLFNTSNYESPENKIVHVEFDSVANTWIDPEYGHVGINVNSLRSVNYTAWNASLHSGHPTDAWVSYNASTHMLSLSWSYQEENTPPKNTSLSYKIDLREVVPEWVTIGFSGTTGVVIEKQILQNWKFSSSLNTGQKREDKSNKRKLIVGLIVPLGAVLVLLGVIAIAIFLGNRKSTQKSLDTVALTSINEDLERGAGPKRFSYNDLALATNNFANYQKLGEGGFGSVYKGYLPREGMMIAVKKISQGSKQGKKEYITEVKIFSSLRHRNLVQLIGWCHDETQFLLVYEFMPNGSLDSHLFHKKSPLEWGVRYKIAMGLASALFYLHEECEQCVVHRDIKASNILLDSGFNAKLGDFGLARLMDHELGRPQTTGLAGTLGYMSPEYIATGKASKESDVYSFGVVALEIACGRKAMDRIDETSDLGLVEWVWDLFGKGELLSGVDQMLCKEFDEKEVRCLMMVGLWCAYPDKILRPSIHQAIQVLKFECALPNLPMNMPVPIYYIPADYPELSSTSASMSKTSMDLGR